MVQRAVVTIIAAALVALGNSACSSTSGGFGPAATSGLGAPLRNAAPKTRVRIREFSDLPVYYDYYSPSAIATGPDKALYVTDDIDQDFGECAVVRILPSGKSTNTFYYGGVTSEGASFEGITAGPDGALWITDEYNGQILRMTTGGDYTGYFLKTPASPYGITVGADKALWFTEYGSIGRITTKGKIVTYPLSGDTYGITAGSDGALWFTEPEADKIGRITTRGKITEYANGISPGAYPWAIAAGPDGALWFTEASGGRIGRITTGGNVTEYSNGITPSELPEGITAGADGAMWFTEFESASSYRVGASKIGRITTGGKIEEYSRHLTASAGPTGITTGPDGNLWFVESALNRVGRAKI